ncbi:hypothetical protein HY485_05195, partial [Candidatus Woesearchaeota archaeon]|nr:hypothetical protein [Candidatus Woesearchaeota archaeon]
MTYEIPQSLQYKERVIFNLTIHQSIYAAIFITTSFVVYTKTPLPILARITIIALFLIACLLFMFLDLGRKIQDFLAYFSFRRATMFDKRMKKYLKLVAVENACYYLRINKKVEKRIAVLKVEPLNFKIKPKDERDSIIYSFQKFLNSLDFPIQFLMYTDDLNLDTYLKELEIKVSKNNKTGQELFKAHKNYLDKIMKERLAVNRKFLIAIQENEIGLDAQIKIIKEHLNNVNLKCVRLGGRNLINILIKL